MCKGVTFLLSYKCQFGIYDTVFLRKGGIAVSYTHLLLIFIFYSVAYIMILPFVEVYTSGVTDANYIRPLSATLFAIMGLLNCIRTPGATLINAIGHYDETKNRSIIEMVICFTLEMIFVQKFGMNGVLLGTIVAYAYSCLLYTSPEVKKYVDAYTDEMKATLLLPAGVTSLASIKFKDEDEVINDFIALDMAVDEAYIYKVLPQKMVFNLEYLKTFSLWKDIRLCLNTIVDV